MADLSELKAEVERTRGVVDSAVALINGIAGQIEAAVAANDAGDNSQLAELSASVRGQADDLAAAVAANPAPAG